ncbi:MAG: LTA synthase family protein [Desulfobacterales bacterium]|nr:LTA synthase family protein [Desulfobacterales bacterium]
MEVLRVRGRKDSGLAKWASSPWGPLLQFAVQVWVGLSLFRLGLLIWKWDRLKGLGDAGWILLYGLRMDTIVLCYVLAVPVLLAPLLNGFSFTHSVWKKFAGLWLSATFFFLFFMEAVTPFFIEEYDTRPNRLFVEYMEYPREVGAMLWGGYKAELFLGGLVVFFLLWFARRVFPAQVAVASSWRMSTRLICLPIMALLVFAGARSSMGRRPANPSNVAFTSDQLVNSLPLSSGYSLVYAIYRMKDEADASELYGKMNPERALFLVRESASKDLSLFQNAKVPTAKPILPVLKHSTLLNLVIVIEESMGAEFVGRMGGLPLTPNLDRLAEEGLFFDQLYATGTRSVRGLEAILTGFLPTPARSVVKLGKAQSGFFTLASFLKTKGYKTRFVYGGAANFDNMKGFFLGNGFDEVIEEKDFSEYRFKGSWGVSDEDLFAKADALLDADGKSPSLTVIFTSSNHTPFEFPDNAISLYEEPKATVNNAVKYADYALGRFFEMAKKSSYWERSLFLVVADHNSRVYGDALVPIERFRIPALIIGPGVTPGVYDRVASQVDLAPTLLSALGMKGETPMLGRDVMKVHPALKGRAIMQFYKNLAYMEEDNVVVLQPGGKALQFRYREKKLEPTSLTHLLVEKALAHVTWASKSYRERLYTLP